MEFSVYGSLRAGLNQSSTDDVDDTNTLAGNNVINPTIAKADGADDDDLDEVEGRDTLDLGVDNAGLSRFGIKGSEDLGNGMSAGFHFERGLDGSGDGNTLNRRHENVWIGGGWGKFTLGQQGNPYRAVANWDQSWLLGGQNRFKDGGTRNSGIRYDSANLGPVRFSLMATADDADGAQAGYAIEVNEADADTIHATEKSTVTFDEVKDEDGIDSVIATVHFDIGDIATVNLGLRTNNQESNVPGTEDGGSYDNAAISANGSAGPLGWYVAYEENSDNFEEGTVVHRTAAPDASLAPAYIAERNVAQDAETVGVFLSLSVSDSDLLYMEYEDSSVDGVDANLESLDQEAILLGYTHAFGPHATLLVEYVTVDKASDYAADSSTLWAGLKVDF